MPAYMVVQATVTKPEQFAEYAERMPALVEKYGGTYRVLGGEVETLEGDWGLPGPGHIRMAVHGPGPENVAFRRIRGTEKKCGEARWT